MARIFALLLAALLFALPASAANVSCIGTASTGAVTSCVSGETYGISVTNTAQQILGNDSGRTSLWVQNNGANPVVVTFGDVALGSSPYNGILLQATPGPGNAFYWTNMPQGNTPGITQSLTVSIITTTSTSQAMFMYTH